MNNEINKKGFTLIELLIVITLLGVIGTITSQIFLLGTRSQAKSEILKEVKQNGDFIQTVVEGMVRNAADVNVSSCNNSDLTMTITNPDGYETTFTCPDETLSEVNISSNSGVSTIALNSTRTRVSNCSFRVVCPTPALAPKYVFFSFSICQSGASSCPGQSDQSAESRANIDYQTTVSLRNYQ